MPTATQKRVEELRQQLHHHNHLYYIESRPEISDREFDKLLQELIDLEKAHPEWVTPDSPTQRVGGDVQTELKPVRHAVPMMSIENTYSEEEVRAFDERVKRGLDGSVPAYVLEPKIDGTSISLRYVKGSLFLAATRGRGNVGEDVTVNARRINSVPLRLNDDKGVPIPEVVEVRGEVYMDNADFQWVNKQIAEEGEEPYKNPRNLTSGTLRRLDPKIVAKRKLRFLSHGLGEVDPLPVKSYWEWVTLLKNWGLPLPKEVKRVENIDDAIAYIYAFEKIRPSLPYMTDGLVMKVDAFAHRDALGATSKAPRWVIAFKYETEQQPTVLNNVEWQVGKGGSLTPVGRLEPVFIGGVTVSNVTLHNIDQIRKLDLHIGDTVVIERAGEVIPYLVQAIPDKRPKGAKPVEEPSKCPTCHAAVEREALPEETVAYRCLNAKCPEHFIRHKVKKEKVPADCPTCGKKLEVLEAGIDLYCPNPACPDQIKGRLQWYCGRSQMDIEGIGDKLIDQLVEKGLVQTFADLYKLKVDDISTVTSETGQGEKLVIRTVGEKTATKVVQKIENSRKQGLERLLAGLGIHHVGNRVAYVLATSFGSLDGLSAASVEELVAVNEIGKVIADSVHDFFHNEAGKQVILALQAVGIDPKTDVRKTDAAPSADELLAGNTIVVTGTMKTLSRLQIEELIVKLGGKASGSVSKKTSFVVAGGEAGSKLAKAKELGVEVLTEEEFLKRVAPTRATGGNENQAG